MTMQTLDSAPRGWREELQFLVTNRVPRNLLSVAMGKVSKVRSPLLTRLALGIWQQFDGDFRLHEAERQSFQSIHEFFTRRLRPGARKVDERAGVLASPCDGIIGAYGAINAGQVFQAKGYPYALSELLKDETLAKRYHHGSFVTLRLKSSMYHRFHAPRDCQLEQVRYISGDRWNVHPPALKRIEKLYCQNERVVAECLGNDSLGNVCLVAVGAILVSSIRLHCLAGKDIRETPEVRDFSVEVSAARGDELGYFEHGSTIIVLTERSLRLANTLAGGDRVFMGQALLTANNVE